MNLKILLPSLQFYKFFERIFSVQSFDFLEKKKVMTEVEERGQNKGLLELLIKRASESEILIFLQKNKQNFIKQNKEEFKKTEMSFILKFGYIEVLSLYLNYFGEIYFKNQFDQEKTFLLFSASEGCLKTIKFLCEHQLCTKYEITRNGSKDALNFASDAGHLEVVKYLIEEQGFDVDSCTKTGWTPFMTACDQGK